MESKLVLVLPLKLALFLATISLIPSTHSTSFLETTHIVMPHSNGGSSATNLHRSSSVAAQDTNCLSWRLNVETNNIQKWKVVPQICKSHVINYFTKTQYKYDIEIVTHEATDYANNITLTGDGKDIWVLDIGQTCLSLLEYYARPDVQYGTVAFNKTSYGEWYSNAKVPAIPEVVRLYKKLLKLGFKVVFISSSKGSKKSIESTAQGLTSAGYTGWEKIIMKSECEYGLSASEFKAKKRTELVEEEGYKIWGNIGDQWSDLSYPNPGYRTFKFPNPMFYIA